jgi:hypothetical protein
LMHWQISCLLFDKVGIVTTSRRLKLVNTANSNPIAYLGKEPRCSEALVYIV